MRHRFLTVFLSLMLASLFTDQLQAQTNSSISYSPELKAKAEAGDARAQTDLGTCYFYGNGVTKNLEAAARWCRKAADQGDAVGQRKLGLCYEYGYGVKKDPTKAIELYRKAAVQGDAEGKRLLAKHEAGDKVATTATAAATSTSNKVAKGDYDSPSVDQRAAQTKGETSKPKTDIVPLFHWKPNPDGISNVLSGEEGEARHYLLAVPVTENPSIITTYYGHDETLLVHSAETGEVAVNRTNVNHAVVIRVGKEVLTGTAAGPVPLVSSDVPRDKVREVKTVAGMTVGMANCVEVKGKDGKSLPYMVIFDDGGLLVTTYCVNTEPDPNYRLIPCTVSGEGLKTTTQLPPEVTRVTRIGSH